jgi:methylated-DNA-protein-cysteine methyltransferase-like protein
MEAVKEVPFGKVVSYGQVAAEVRANARTVGWAMANITDSTIPWHRVVGADGGLRIGRRSPDLMLLQRSLLEKEGVLANGRVDMDKHNK